MNKPSLMSVVFEFCQEGNTLQTTNEEEVLLVRCEYQQPGDEPFYTIKTDTGWSIDSSEELTDLLKCCEAGEELARRKIAPVEANKT